ncbi:hypothetical protein Fmac_026770 [Flemingia macrophylla]|uniref:Uncharacterized protein n=1 Tax=Flemingia macrophylla TaxID=520843 RepID=A0ABD1LFT7_9FABA
MPGFDYEALKQKTDTLESALLVLSLLPWQEVTAQLFAHISSHPEQAIWKQLEGFLTVLAKQSPCSIRKTLQEDIGSNQERFKSNSFFNPGEEKMKNHEGEKMTRDSGARRQSNRNSGAQLWFGRSAREPCDELKKIIMMKGRGYSDTNVIPGNSRT